MKPIIKQQIIDYFEKTWGEQPTKECLELILLCDKLIQKAYQRGASQKKEKR